MVVSRPNFGFSSNFPPVHSCACSLSLSLARLTLYLRYLSPTKPDEPPPDQRIIVPPPRLPLVLPALITVLSLSLCLFVSRLLLPPSNELDFNLPCASFSSTPPPSPPPIPRLRSTSSDLRLSQNRNNLTFSSHFLEDFIRRCLST
ncbi:hypothetical protein BT93_H1690 [Corymbia citriodora subsp. variegata]|nr:hypothetical protein BT93_H1690 [Corymbia citriodora subsp. variegata]